jgi:hypothetical protein
MAATSLAIVLLTALLGAGAPPEADRDGPVTKLNLKRSPTVAAARATAPPPGRRSRRSARWSPGAAFGSV